MRKHILMFLLLILCVALSGCTGSGTVSPTAAPAATDAPSAAPAETAVPARGYVYVTAGDEGRWFPLQDEEYSITVRRTLESGEQTENVITFFADGVRMQSSSCENQDCVEQEEVTLANKDTRVLANWIICLPNQVSIELYTPEELLTMSHK